MRFSDWVVWKKELYCKRLKKILKKTLEEYVKVANSS